MSSAQSAEMNAVGPLADPLTATLAAAVPPGLWSVPAVVGVSGGADSVALLLGLLAIAPPNGRQRLVVAHAEHDLRAAAADDRAFVERLAADMGIEIVCRRLAVREGARRSEGVEARARRLRYAYLADVARDRGARHVMVAHTADDQAETILHRALRGTGLRGLAGMRPARELCPGISLLRPLLAADRTLVRGFLRRVGAAWCEDESNADLAFSRNYLRHEILARCTAGPYPAAGQALVRLGRHAASAAAAVRSAAEHLLSIHATRHADGSVVLRAQGLATLDAGLVAEVCVELWQREGWPQRDMTAVHYARLATLIRGAGPAAIDLPGGVHARSEPVGHVRLQPAAQ